MDWSCCLWRSSSEAAMKACCCVWWMGVVGKDRRFFCKEWSSLMVCAFTGAALSSWQIPWPPPWVRIFVSPFDGFETLRSPSTILRLQESRWSKREEKALIYIMEEAIYTYRCLDCSKYGKELTGNFLYISRKIGSSDSFKIQFWCFCFCFCVCNSILILSFKLDICDLYAGSNWCRQFGRIGWIVDDSRLTSGFRWGVKIDEVRKDKGHTIYGCYRITVWTYILINNI